MATPNLQPHLTGDLLELRPIRPDDWQELFAAASDPLIWELHPASDRYQEEVFRGYFEGALASGGGLVIIDPQTGKIIGSSCYAKHADGLEIGWTFLTRPYWGGTYNKELKRLMTDHAFTFTDLVIFTAGETNWRSRRALEKIGAVLTDRSELRQSRGQDFVHLIYELRRPG